MHPGKQKFASPGKAETPETHKAQLAFWSPADPVPKSQKQLEGGNGFEMANRNRISSSERVGYYKEPKGDRAIAANS